MCLSADGKVNLRLMVTARGRHASALQSSQGRCDRKQMAAVHSTFTINEACISELARVPQLSVTMYAVVDMRTIVRGTPLAPSSVQ